MKKILVFLLIVSLMGIPAFAEQPAATQQPVPSQTEEPTDQEESFAESAVGTTIVDKNDLSVNPDLDSDWMNVLLLGTDTHGNQVNVGRTDVMIIASLNKKTGEIKLASLQRDMSVVIPINNYHNRINTANVWGGPYLAVKTVNDVLAMNIEHYCIINFKGFSKVVDEFGGVDVSMAEDGVTGMRHMNGFEALEFVRERQTIGNAGRNNRQRRVIEALLNKVMREGDMKHVVDAATIVLQHVETNLTMADLMRIIPVAMKFTGKMDKIDLPLEGDFHYAELRGSGVIEFDREKTRKALHTFIYGEK